jgi:hypothetical protein
MQKMDHSTQITDLPRDALSNIVARLNCIADREHLAAMCHTCADAAPTGGSNPQLPWILLPQEKPDTTVIDGTIYANFFCSIDNKVHRIRVPTITFAARAFGTYKGGWLFCYLVGTGSNIAVNIYSGLAQQLPHTTVWEGGFHAVPMQIHALALSCGPEKGTRCVAAALVTLSANNLYSGRHVVTFWRMGSPLASCAVDCDADDVIFHAGSFQFITRHGNIFVAMPVFHEELAPSYLQVMQSLVQFLPITENQSQHILARYLVESRGEILMVVRVSRHANALTKGFRLFRKQNMNIHHGMDGLHIWQEIHSLNGRMIFVGRGCSKCFECVNYPACREGVYFIDDRRFRVGGLLTADRVNGVYSCEDRGKWFHGCQSIDRWNIGTKTSNYSPQVWFHM